MPKSSNQKLKLLYLRRILLEETDDNHHLNAEQLVSKLERPEFYMHCCRNRNISILQKRT